MLLPLGLGIAMGFASYFSPAILHVFRRVIGQLTSFAAGVAVTYVFLQLFPEFVESIRLTYHPALFLSVLFGFSSFYLVEKYIYQHSDRNRLLKELAIEDSIISFIYHLIIGILLVELFLAERADSLLFFVPIFLNTAIHALPVDIARSRTARSILSTATLIGVIIALFFYDPGAFTITMLTGFIVGTLIFSVIRHSLPSGREGRPTYFILGMLAYSLIIVLNWGITSSFIPA